MATVSNVLASGNVLVDTLVNGTRWDSGTPKTVITVGYLTTGSHIALPNAAELAALQALEVEFERFLNVDIQLVGIDNSRAADITFGINTNPAETDYGWAYLPGDGALGAGGGENSRVAIMRHNYESGTAAALKPGSFDYITFVHEFGHAVGLAHSHEGGNLRGPFPGVTSAYNSYGTGNLNQGIFTTMGYNDGWRMGPTGLSPSHAYGWQSGMMALDIMALQRLYGANTNFNGGNTSYALPGGDGIGVGFTCLWDTGGLDNISVAPTFAKVCTIDLRAATGVVAYGGGGFVSYATGVHGGFTIAKGVIIEQAFGGAANDLLIGNAFANVLVGRGGKDTITGLGGADVFDYNAISESNASANLADVITDFSTAGGDRIDFRTIDTSNASGDQAFAYRGNSASFTAPMQVRWQVSGPDTLVMVNTDTDQAAELIIRLSGQKALLVDDFLL